MSSSSKGGFLRDDTTGALMVQGTADRDNGHAGLLTPTGTGWVFSTQAVAANQARFARFVPSRDMTITSIAIAVTTASSVDDAVDVGIYDASMNKIVSSGATTGKLNSTGTKSVAIASTVVRAGTVYYAALSCGAVGGTAATLLGASFGTAFATKMFGATAGLIEADLMSSAHPLPATLTISGASGVGYALALLEG